MENHERNLDYLTTYLSEMGRCGRHFTMHHRLKDHSFECRRAMLALELASEYKINDSEGSIFWKYAVEFIEAINGGVFYGLPGLWLEIPSVVAHFDSQVVQALAENPREIYERQILPRYKTVLKAALRECFRTMRGIDLSEGGLAYRGLQPDPPIDYENL